MLPPPPTDFTDPFTYVYYIFLIDLGVLVLFYFFAGKKEEEKRYKEYVEDAEYEAWMKNRGGKLKE